MKEQAEKRRLENERRRQAVGRSCFRAVNIPHVESLCSEKRKEKKPQRIAERRQTESRRSRGQIRRGSSQSFAVAQPKRVPVGDQLLRDLGQPCIRQLLRRMRKSSYWRLQKKSKP